jgi:hypothetical protein
MDWQIIAQVFGGLLVVVVGYAYLSDKRHTQEQIRTLTDRLGKLEK